MTEREAALVRVLVFAARPEEAIVVIGNAIQ
jgi:hypothetical protein